MNSPAVLFLGILLSALCYYGGFVLTLTRFNTKKAVWGVWLAGEAFNLFLIVNNYLINGYVPFISMFQVLIFLAACFMPACLYLTYAGKCRGYERYFLLVAAVVMTGPLFMDKNAVWTYPPALQSPFFVPHILVYMISYTLAAVAFVIVVMKLVNKEREDGAAYYCIKTLFPFMTSGMLLGAIWADQVWGDFWSWDIKECWSLVSWLAYMLYLHCYRKKSLQKYCPAIAIIGFVCVVITFLFANVADGGSKHSYS